VRDEILGKLLFDWINYLPTYPQMQQLKSRTLGSFFELTHKPLFISGIIFFIEKISPKNWLI